MNAEGAIARLRLERDELGRAVVLTGFMCPKIVNTLDRNREGDARTKTMPMKSVKEKKNSFQAFVEATMAVQVRNKAGASVKTVRQGASSGRSNVHKVPYIL